MRDALPAGTILDAARKPDRDILNAIFSILTAGCIWRLLPHDLPPWKTVSHYFRIWSQDGTLELIQRFSRLQLIWADSAYAGQLVEWVQKQCRWVLEIVKRPAGMTGFQVL